MNAEAQVLPSDTVMSRILARWSFPVTLVVLTGIGIVAMQRGYSPLVTLTVRDQLGEDHDVVCWSSPEAIVAAILPISCSAAQLTFPAEAVARLA